MNSKTLNVLSWLLIDGFHRLVKWTILEEPSAADKVLLEDELEVDGLNIKRKLHLQRSTKGQEMAVEELRNSITQRLLIEVYFRKRQRSQGLMEMVIQ